MNNIPPKLRNELAADPDYQTCMRRDWLNAHICQPDPATGKLIEWEHAIIHAGKQVQQRFAIVPICWWAHRGPGLVKEINVWIALMRATDEQLRPLSRAVDLIRERKRLNDIYGTKK